jgi:hypothetical protein
MRLCRQA